MRDGKRPAGRRWLSSYYHPARRDGAAALGFFLLPGLIAVILLSRHHHIDGGTVAILVSVSLGLPVLWLTWALFRDSRRTDDKAQNLADVADQLAIAVRLQWEAEAGMHGLNDPFPLPVSWTAADSSFTDSWESLVELASYGAGWPAPPLAGIWASSPDDLRGTGSDLSGVLSKVPTRRLVVLGEPGSGKTMLMVRLVLDLLARRTPGTPVPFLASAASWNPEKQNLADWLAGQLIVDHPGLRRPGRRARAARWRTGCSPPALFCLCLTDSMRSRRRSGHRLSRG